MTAINASVHCLPCVHGGYVFIPYLANGMHTQGCSFMSGYWPYNELTAVGDLRQQYS